VLRRSPPRRPASPDEGVRSLYSMGHSASGGAASASGSAAASCNGGSGPLVMSSAGSTYGANSYGSANYGSGSYTSSPMAKAKSPCRAAVMSITASRASPPRNTTPRAAQRKQSAPQAFVQAQAQTTQRGVIVSGSGSGSGSSLPAMTAGVAGGLSGTLAPDAGSATVPGMSLHSGGGSLSAPMHSNGGSLTVGSGSSLTAAAALSSWPSPPRGATSPVSLGHGFCVTRALSPTSSTATTIGTVDGARGGSAPRTAATSPARSGISLSGGSQFRR
jgi:hypothetical protein